MQRYPALHALLEQQAWPSPPHAATQPPPWQSFPAPQTLLQVPQLFASLARFAQDVPQHVRPVWQLHRLQTPERHCAVTPVHCFPQTPQFCLSVIRFTQAPPHLVSDDEAHLQEPLEQVSLASQALPQAPQFFGSLAVFTHEPEQSVSVPQFASHLPDRQTAIALHDFPQVPQWSWSANVCDSQPSAALPLQSAHPALHASTEQLPAVHPAVACGKPQGAQPGPPQP